MDLIVAKLTKPMSIQVRAMTEADIHAALDLWSVTEGVEIAEGDSPAKIARYLTRNPGLSSVALDGTRLIAAVMCGHDGRRGFVYHLAVAADRRGRGVARQILKRSVDALRNEGIGRALLLVDSSNSAGQQFWLKESWEDMSFARPMGIDL